MSHTQHQAVYIKPETTFGDGTGDFSGATGLKVYPLEKISTDNINTKMEPTSNVVSSWSELPPLPSVTFKEGTAPLKIPLSGATRAAGVITEDNLSKLLALILGTRSFSVKDACAAACTTTSIVVAGAGTYAVGALVMIAGEVRRVATWDGGSKTFTVLLPFSAAPGAAAVIYGVESFETSGDVATFAMGLKHDFSGQEVLLKGCLAKTFGIEGLTNADKVVVTCDIEAADHSIGSGIVTNASTNEVQNQFVTCAAGGQIAMLDNTGALLELLGKSVELVNPISEVFVDSIDGINGKSGHERLPGEEPIKFTITAYETATTMSSLVTALAKDNNQLVIAIGNTPGACVGLVLAGCFVSDYPKFADGDKKLFVKFQLSGTGLTIFRA